MRAQACHRLSTSWALLCPVPTEKEGEGPRAGEQKAAWGEARREGQGLERRGGKELKGRRGQRKGHYVRSRGGIQKGTGQEARQAELSLTGLGLTLRAASSDSFFSRFFSSRGNFS